MVYPCTLRQVFDTPHILLGHPCEHIVEHMADTCLSVSRRREKISADLNNRHEDYRRDDVVWYKSRVIRRASYRLSEVVASSVAQARSKRRLISSDEATFAAVLPL